MSIPPALGVFPKVNLRGQPQWVPGDFDLHLIDGDPEIHIHVLNDGTAGEPMVGFACGKPSTFEVNLGWYETVHVLEGRADVEVGGAVVELGPGDATTFFPGRVARWTIIEPITEFFVMSDARPADSDGSDA